MMRERLKGYRSFLHATRGVLSENPVLVYGLALPLAVVSSVSLKNAVALSLAMLVATVPLMVFDALVGRVLPGRLAICRAPVCVMLASVLLYFATFLVRILSPDIFDSLGIYYPLVAVNSVMLLQVGGAREKVSVATVAQNGLRSTLGFTLAVCGISALREILGSGTLWGIVVPLAERIPSVLLPFFGFVFLGLLSAGARHADRMLKLILLRTEKRSTKVVGQ